MTDLTLPPGIIPKPRKIATAPSLPPGIIPKSQYAGAPKGTPVSPVVEPRAPLPPQAMEQPKPIAEAVQPAIAEPAPVPSHPLPPGVVPVGGRGPLPPKRFGPPIVQHSGGYSRAHANDLTPAEIAEGFGKNFVKGGAGAAAGAARSIDLLPAAVAQRELETYDRISRGDPTLIWEPQPNGFLTVTDQKGNGLPFVVRPDDDLAHYILDPTQRPALEAKQHAIMDVENRPVTKIANQAEQAVQKALPTTRRQDENFWTGPFAQGAGSTVVFAAGGVAGPAGIAAIGAGAQADQGFKDALAHGADLKTAFASAGYNALGGMTEAVPITHLFGRLNHLTGGKFRDALAQAVLQGGEEGGQEFVQQVIGNVTAAGLYDPNRGLLDGAGDNALVGAVTGMLFGGGGAAIAPQRTAPNRVALEKSLNTPPPAAQPQQDAAQTAVHEGPPQEPEKTGQGSATFQGDGTKDSPRLVTTPEDLTEASSQAASSPMNARPEPTEAQKAAGNYPKAHIKLQGLNIAIETPKGGVRRGVGPEGPWEVEMPVAYGYDKAATGADGDKLDISIGDNPEATEVYVIDQLDPTTGDFDEHKVFAAEPDMVSAIQHYDQSFSGGGQDRIGAVTPMSIDEYNTWKKSRKAKQPLGNIAAAQQSIRDRLAEQQALAAQPGAAPAVPNQTQPAPSTEPVTVQPAESYGGKPLPKGIVPKKSRGRKQPWVSITGLAKAWGGIVDYGGELRAMDMHRLRPGSVRVPRGDQRTRDAFGGRQASHGLDAFAEHLFQTPEYRDLIASDRNPGTWDTNKVLELLRQDLAGNVPVPRGSEIEASEAEGERREEAFREQKWQAANARTQELLGRDLDENEFEAILARYVNKGYDSIEDAVTDQLESDVIADVQAKPSESHGQENVQAQPAESRHGDRIGAPAERGSEHPSGPAQEDEARARSADEDQGRAPARGPQTELTDQGGQAVMPGMERSAKQAAQARDEKRGGKMGTDKHQDEPGGMFDQPDDRQTDIEDMERQREAELQDSKDPDDRFLFQAINERRDSTRKGPNLRRRAAVLGPSRASSSLVHRLYLELRKIAVAAQRREGTGQRITLSPGIERDLNIISRFVSMIGEGFFSDIGTSVRRSSDTGAIGQYDGYQRIVTIFHNAIEEGQLSRTAVHELWHSLQRFVPIEMRGRFETEFNRARRKFWREHPFMRDLMTATGGWINGQEVIDAFYAKHPEARGHEWVIVDNSNRIDGKTVPMIGASYTDETYRYVNLEEFFAETMTDRAFAAQDMQDEMVGNVFTAFRRLYAELVYLMKRLIGRAVGGRIFRGFTRGEFQRDFQREGGIEFAAMDIHNRTGLDRFVAEMRTFANPNAVNAGVLAAGQQIQLDILKQLHRPGWRAFAERRLRTFRLLSRDRFATARDIENHIEGKTGQKIPAQKSFYKNEEVFTGKVADQLQQFHEGMLKDLYDAMHDSGLSVKEIERYLVAMHAPERNATIAAINPNLPVGGSGMMNAEALKVIDGFRNAGKLQALQKIGAVVKRIRMFDLNTRVAAGLIPARDVAQKIREWPNYVPLKGFEELFTDDELVGRARPRLGSGFSVKNREYFSAMGRQSEAQNILANLISQAEESIVRAEKTKVAQTLADMVAANPDDSFWRVDLVTTKRVIDPDTGLVQVQQTRMPSLEDEEQFVIYFKRDGQLHRIWIANPRLVANIRNMSANELPKWTKALQLFGTIFRAVNVNANPEFILPNAARDLETGLVQALQHKAPGLKRKMVKYWPQAAKASWAGYGGKQGPAGTWLGWYRRMARAGGKVDFFNIDDIGSKVSSIKGEMRRRSGKPLAHAENAMRGIFHLVDRANHAVENAVRLAAFRAMVEAGFTDAEAASVSKNITVNFNRRGEWSRVANLAYPFFNAAVQGTFTLGSATVRSRKVRGALAALTMMGFLEGIANGLISSGGAGDDGDETDFDKIPPFIKRKNVIIMNPGYPKNGGPPYWTIPLGYGLNVFWAAGREISDLALGKKTVGQAMGEVGIAAADAFLPVDLANNLPGLAPTAVEPVAEVQANQDYAGKPIYREPTESESAAGLPDSSITRPGTNEVWKETAKALNRMSGGTDYEPGLFDVHPESLEHLFKTYAGGVGSIVSRTADVLKPEPGDKFELGRLPVIRKVIGYFPRSTESNRYYEERAEIQQATGRLKAAEDVGDEASAERIAGENERQLGLESELKRSDKRLAALRKEAREVQKDPSMTPTDRKAALSDIYGTMDEETAGFNKTFYQEIERPRQIERSPAIRPLFEKKRKAARATLEGEF